MANILIADDALFMRASIKKIVEDAGHTVIGEAASGEEAISKFAELKPDVLILDITMPGMNGIDALKGIMAVDAAARIIICSALGQPAVIANAIESGAKEFIVKPFESAHLLAAIEKIMRN